MSKISGQFHFRTTVKFQEFQDNWEPWNGLMQKVRSTVPMQQQCQLCGQMKCWDSVCQFPASSQRDDVLTCPGHDICAANSPAPAVSAAPTNKHQCHTVHHQWHTMHWQTAVSHGAPTDTGVTWGTISVTQCTDRHRCHTVHHQCYRV